MTCLLALVGSQISTLPSGRYTGAHVGKPALSEALVSVSGLFPVSVLRSCGAATLPSAARGHDHVNLVSSGRHLIDVIMQILHDHDGPPGRSASSRGTPTARAPSTARQAS
jgi:hypothetical protein